MEIYFGFLLAQYNYDVLLETAIRKQLYYNGSAIFDKLWSANPRYVYVKENTQTTTE